MIEAYKIGIRLHLINGISSGLTHIIDHFNKASGGAKAFKAELKEIRNLTLAGAAVGGVGFAGLNMVSKTIKPASEYVHQLALMNNEGMKHLDIVKATNAAWDAAKAVPTTTVSENLAAIRELKMVFRGSAEHATQFMPTVQKIQSILETTRHGEPGSGKSEAYELAKAMEMKGAVYSPAQFVGNADLMTKAIVASGGKINASDYLSAFKYGRAATAGWSDEFTYKYLPTLIQEMKSRGGSGSAAGGPGTALMSMYSTIVGGVVTQRALKTWQELGLVDPKKVSWTKDGHVKGVLPGGIRGTDVMIESPYKWVNDILMPAMKSHGYTDEKSQRTVLQYLFANRTAGFVASQFALQPWKFEGDKGLIEQAKGIGGYEELLKTDPMMAKMALAKQWENLMTILGFQIMPPFIKGLQLMVSGTRALTEWMRRHGTATKVLVVSFTLLSAAMAFSGTLMVLVGGFRALRLVLPLLTGAGSASSIPALAAALGKGGLVMAAGAAGFAIGTLVNKLLGIEHGELGSWFYDKLHDKDGNNVLGPTHWMGKTSPETRDAILRGLGGNKNAPVRVTTKVNIDGRQVASIVSKHQANEASKPQIGTGRFDSILTPMPVGY